MMTTAPTPNPPAPPKVELWYKSAVIYEVHVRAFQDSDGDGTGDFRGLTSRLDYLRDLGVTAIWLLPFYPSPLKDDGYDIADYYGVHPRYGTLADFKVFLREAHRRGIAGDHGIGAQPHVGPASVVPARPPRQPGSRWRDYYVWSDTPEKYKGTRIIFKDTEISNWTWDPVANAYYWHRFYSHQPDLNFDNPRGPARKCSTSWISGWTWEWTECGWTRCRICYEREGTSCENLPETHEFLKRLRKHVDDKLQRPHVAGGGQPMAGRRGGLFRRGHGRRMPHGLSFSADAAVVHGLADGGPDSHRGHPAANAGHSGNGAMGACSCATTTN